MTLFAKRLYYAYTQQSKTAMEFMLNLDGIHERLTKKIKNAHPPRFKYKRIGRNILEITYISERNLIEFAIGLVKGVGEYYNENLQVLQLDKKRFSIKFLDQK